MESGKINSDLACRSCGYNLRGLPFDHQCPECGEPTLATVADALSGVIPQAEDIRDDLRRQLYLPVAEATGCTVDGVLFVIDATAAARSLAHAGAGTHITASQVCGGILAHAARYFNDKAEAKELLSEWGIHRSEDVGRIIFSMVEKGLIKAGDSDSIEQFNGLFTLESLFENSDKN